MTGFEAPVLAFLATMAGLAGPGRRDGVRGIGGVTSFGWCALLVAACSLGVSLWQVRRAELERAEVAALVNADVATATGQLIGVLQILTMVPVIAGPGGQRYDIPGLAVDPFEDIPELAQLDDPRQVERLKTMHLAGDFRINDWYTFPNTIRIPRMGDVFGLIASETSKAQALLASRTTEYGLGLLGADLYLAAKSAANQPYLEFLKGLEVNWRRRAAQEDTELPEILHFTALDSGVPGGSSEDYIALVTALKAVEVLTRAD